MRDFLNDCRSIETIASQIYQQLAGDPNYAMEVRSVFRSLCNDERDHARQFDLILQTAEHELDALNRISAEQVEAALQMAKSMAATLDRRRLSEEEALRLAVEMEQRFLNVHVHNTLHFDNQRLAALFNDLGRYDEGHVDQLRQCLQWWHAVRKPQLRNH